MKYQVIIKVIPNKKHFTVSVTFFFSQSLYENIILDLAA